MAPDFVQEYRAGQAAERLRQSVAVRGRVLRDGKLLEIPLAEMVPGDVSLLAAGDLIPCDGRVLEPKDVRQPGPLDWRSFSGGKISA